MCGLLTGQLPIGLCGHEYHHRSLLRRLEDSVEESRACVSSHYLLRDPSGGVGGTDEVNRWHLVRGRTRVRRYVGDDVSVSDSEAMTCVCVFVRGLPVLSLHPCTCLPKFWQHLGSASALRKIGRWRRSYARASPLQSIAKSTPSTRTRKNQRKNRVRTRESTYPVCA